MGKPPKQNQILNTEHVFIAGMTGTGKSVLARKYLSGFDSVWKLDTKGEALDDLAEGKNPWPEIDPKKLTIIFHIRDLKNVQTPFVIYAPHHTELNLDFYEMFFYQAYHHRDLQVWVDEAMSVSPNPHVIPEHYKAILTRGRSRKTTVWSLTQRPAGIHNLILSQCTHIFGFNLRLPKDRKSMAETTGCPEFFDNPEGHNFWYYRDGWTHAEKARLVLKGGE